MFTSPSYICFLLNGLVFLKAFLNEWVYNRMKPSFDVFPYVPYCSWHSTIFAGILKTDSYWTGYWTPQAFQACEDTWEGKGKPKYMIKELILRVVSQRNGEKVFYYLVICMDMSYVVQSYSKFNNTYKQDAIIQMLDFFYRQHICPVWWTCVSTDDWYFNGNKLFSAIR